jgi:tRNA G18 (ribose-2'-O)-methylase SpoU
MEPRGQGAATLSRVPVRIESSSDERLADYRQLKDAAARRRIERDEFFIAEGPIAIERLLASDHVVRSVLVSQSKYQRLESVIGSIEAPVYVVEEDLLHEVAGFDLHRGAIASGDRQPLATIDEVLDSSTRIAVLEGLNDPENVGAIARSARAFGIDTLLLDPTCIDPYTRRTVRVSMGEILFLRCCRTTDWPATFDRLRSAEFETWAMTPNPDADDIWSLDAPRRLAVAFGAEGPGLSRSVLQSADRRIRLPIDHHVDSLNVGAAAAVTFAIIGRRSPE